MAPASRCRNCHGRHEPIRRTSDDGGGAPGGLDLLLGRRAERVRRHLELHAAEFTGTEDLHRLALADPAGLDQLEYPDLPTLREQLGEPVQVHDLEGHLELVVETLE